MALILFNFIFSFYSIIVVLLNILFYADYISTKFYDGANYFEDNYLESGNTYFNYCLNNYFLFIINLVELIGIILFVLSNFFYFYG